MLQDLRERLRELAVRAGLAGVPEPVLVLCLVVAVGVCIAAGVRAWQSSGAAGASVAPGDRPTISRAATMSASGALGAASAEASIVVVHVAGAVARPGLYRLRAGSRAGDAVTAAGGSIAGADCDRVNLAAKLTDGEQLLVPRRSDPAAAGSASAAPTGGGDGSTSGQAGSSPSAAQSSGPVDLNTADETALDALPGVGPATAKRIVDDRNKNGPFKSVEDLMRVSGIGPKKFDELKGLVTTSG